jgi:REP element-mobilizing transposase RayT
MPEERVRQWMTERKEWLAHHPEPHDERTRAEYDRLFAERWELWLDECHGACLLRLPEVRMLVESAIEHNEGSLYRVAASVVMPNHVHVVVTPLGEQRLSDIVQNWKSFTAHAINRLLKRKGTFWQKESFDHIVRNADEMDRIRAYIRDQQVNATSPSRPSSASTVNATSPSRPPKPATPCGGDAASTNTVASANTVDSTVDATSSSRISSSASAVAATSSSRISSAATICGGDAAATNAASTNTAASTDALLRVHNEKTINRN